MHVTGTPYAAFSGGAQGGAPPFVAQSGRPYFKFYGRDFRDGVRGMTPEEVGVYTIVLTLIYDWGGPVPDDAQMPARVGVSARVWRRLRDRLASLGKIGLTDDGCVTNPRAIRELQAASILSAERARAGAEGGRRSGQARRKTANLDETSPKLPPNFAETSGKFAQNPLGDPFEIKGLPEAKPKLSEPEPELETDKSLTLSSESVRAPELELVPAEPKPKRQRKRSSRATKIVASIDTLPKEPTTAMVAEAVARGFVNGRLASVFAKWRDHRLATAREIGDVEADWRWWLSKEVEQRDGAYGGNPTRRPAMLGPKGGVRPLLVG